MTVNITPFFDLAARTALRGQGRMQQPAADEQGSPSANLAKRAAWQREMERAQFNAWFLPFDGRLAMSGTPPLQPSRAAPPAAPGPAVDPANAPEDHEPLASSAEARPSALDEQSMDPAADSRLTLTADEGTADAERASLAPQPPNQMPVPHSTQLQADDGPPSAQASTTSTRSIDFGPPELPVSAPRQTELTSQRQGQEPVPAPAADQIANTARAQGLPAPQAVADLPPAAAHGLVTPTASAAEAEAAPMPEPATQMQPTQVPRAAGGRTATAFNPSPAEALSAPAAPAPQAPISAALAEGGTPAGKPGGPVGDLAAVVRSGLAASLPQLSVPPTASARTPAPGTPQPGAPAASLPDEATPAGLAATVARGLAESAGPARAATGLPSSPRENLAVRLHAQWDEATAHVWLGMDGSAAKIASQVAIIIPELQRQLAGQGQRLGRVVCNGQLVYDPADAPASAQAASFAHAIAQQTPSFSSLDPAAGREALVNIFSPTPQEDS